MTDREERAGRTEAGDHGPEKILTGRWHTHEQNARIKHLEPIEDVYR